MAEDIEIHIDGDIDERVVGEPEVKATTKEAAEKIAAIARSTAPRLSGDYADSITVQKTNSTALVAAANYRVFAEDFKSAWIEFGVPNRNIPAHWNLRRAAESAGYKFTKGH